MNRSLSKIHLKEQLSECLTRQRARGNLRRGWNRIHAASGRPELDDVVKLKEFLRDWWVFSSEWIVSRFRDNSKFEESDVLVLSGGFCNKVFKVRASHGHGVKWRRAEYLRRLMQLLASRLWSFTVLSPSCAHDLSWGVYVALQPQLNSRFLE